MRKGPPFEALSLLPTSSAPASERLARARQAAPLLFVENVGQFDPKVCFQVRAGGATIWLTDDTIWITLLDKPITSTIDLLANRFNPAIAPRSGNNFRLTFPGANLHPILEPLTRQFSHVSYFTGHDASKWRADVPVWGGVLYRELFPGIDLEIHGDSGQRTLSLAASSGAKDSSLGIVKQNLDQALQRVRLRVEGAGQVTVDGDNLQLSTSGGKLSLPLFETSGVPLRGAPLVVGDGADVTVESPFARLNPGR
jgi:hypothetical protein